MNKLIAFIAGLTFAVVAQAGTAFLQSQYVSGMNRICIYDHLGSQVAITVGAAEMCPLSIRV